MINILSILIFLFENPGFSIDLTFVLTYGAVITNSIALKEYHAVEYKCAASVTKMQTNECPSFLDD